MIYRLDLLQSWFIHSGISSLFKLYTNPNQCVIECLRSTSGTVALVNGQFNSYTRSSDRLVHLLGESGN